MSITLLHVIGNTTNFSALETLRGMLAGFYTSPLIKEYDFEYLVPLIKSIRANGEEMTNSMDTAVREQMRAVSHAQRDGVGETITGYHNMGFIRVPIVEQRELTPEDIAPYKEKG